MVSMNPYEFYEILVPVESLTADCDYLIRASYKGATSSDVAIKRKIKTIDADSDELVENSFYSKKYSKAFSKGLRDFREQA